MKIEEIFKTIELQEELISYLKSEIENVEDIYEQVKAEVTKFEYATDEYYSISPLFHEINKFKKGKLLQNIDTDNLEPNTYTFGVNDENQLLLTEKTNGNNSKFGLNSTIYSYKNDNSILFFTFRNYPNKDFQNRVISKGILANAGNNLQIEIIVSNNIENWSLSKFLYEDDKISKIKRIASGWNREIEYDCIYKQNVLTEIKIGGVAW